MPGAGVGGTLSGPGGVDPGGPGPSPYARGGGPPSVSSVTSARRVGAGGGWESFRGKGGAGVMEARGQGKRAGLLQVT